MLWTPETIYFPQLFSNDQTSANAILLNPAYFYSEFTDQEFFFLTSPGDLMLLGAGRRYLHGKAGWDIHAGMGMGLRSK